VTALQEILDKLEKLSPERKAEIVKETIERTKDKLWIPNMGPQMDAYYSKADVLLYGGEPGGGKSSLLLGLALTQHRRSLIMRRQYTDLGHLTEEAQKFNGGKEGYSGAPPPKLKRPDGRLVDFGAASNVGDEQHWMGRPHDFIGIDEATQFAESQIRFLMGWLRSADDPDQRKRVILATNPPLTAEGYWVTEMFAPWIDEKFPDPAKPGELRWAITVDEKNKWVDGPEPVWDPDKEKYVDPKSFSYIPAAVSDNPYLSGTGYEKELDALPGEIHSILMGGFKYSLKDVPNQIIPTVWVREAQKRWTPTPPHGIPMCAMGVDATGGGSDPMVIAPRYDGWFATLIEIPGKEMPIETLGKTGAGHVVANRRDQADVIIDMGGGYGGSMYEKLHENGIPVKVYKGSEKSVKRTRDKKLKFTNVRTAALWMFREALDPDQPGGSPIALPDDPKIMADLTAPTFEVTSQGIKAEPKEKVCERLGRSTNHGDALIMAWHSGARMNTHALEWADQRVRKFRPRVIMGRKHG